MCCTEGSHTGALNNICILTSCVLSNILVWPSSYISTSWRNQDFSNSMITLNASFKRVHIGTSGLKIELSNTSWNFCLGENYKLDMVVTF